jgi:type II secretory pathway pseudopilin PulG
MPYDVSTNGAATKQSKGLLIVALAVLVIVGATAGWWFAVEKPHQKAEQQKLAAAEAEQQQELAVVKAQAAQAEIQMQQQEEAKKRAAQQASGEATRGGENNGNGQLYYAELALSSNTAYVGDAVPIEIRLYVDARVRLRFEGAPKITAEGCSVGKTAKPEQAEVARNGREYVMVTYKTAVTPARSGTLQIGPVQMPAIAQLPEPRPPRQPGGPYDDPAFQNSTFANVFQNMSPPQQIMILGEPVKLTVTPAVTGQLPAGSSPP